jgi:diguanylate cyclase (GGDEF)-like protein/PAS domain S-box-containing protein
MPIDSSADSANYAPQQQAAANLYALIESTEDLIWSIDLDYRIVTFNSAMQSYVGRNFGARIAIGKRPEDFLPPERAAIWPPHFERALATGPYRAEIPFPGNRVVEMSFNLVVVDGKVAGLSMFGKDVTERSGVEKELRETAEFLQETQRIGILGSYVLDIPSARWTSSDVLDDLFGIGNEFDRTTAAWLELVHPDDRATMAEYFVTEVVGKRKKFDKEYRIIRVRDQAVRWMHGMGRLEFDAHGQPLKMRGVIKDITARKLAERAILDSQEFTQSTIDALSTTICVLDQNGVIIAVNRTWREFAQANRDTHGDASVSAPCTFPVYDENANYLEVCDAATGPEAADAAAFAAGIRAVLRGESQQFSLEYACHSPTEQRWFVGRVTRFRASGASMVVIEHIDITAMKQGEALLRETADRLSLSEERYRKVFQTSLDPITINRIDTKQYLDVNEAFLKALGFARDEVIGKIPSDLGIWTHPGDLEKLATLLGIDGECRDLEIEFTTKTGETVWGLVSASLIEIDSVPCALTITRDVTRAKAAEDEIRNLAFYDTLTGLPNRRLLLERLRQAMATSRRAGRLCALLFVDLDHFKMLNDTLGHQTGDLLLQEAATRLVTCVRETDTVGRLGGDEFIVMLTELSDIPEDAAAQAKAVGEKILFNVSQPYLLQGREYRSSASIGISVFGDRQRSASDVLQQADIAMYQAKTAGRNTLRFFAPALQAAVNARAAMEEDLRQAIQASQFVLYYQPQFDRNRLTGAEALLRWKHPVRNILPPDEFIPLAEETGLILPLGKWVLEAACAQIAAWSQYRSSARLSIAVNISARQFRQPEFVEQVLQALAGTGADPRNLKLELTESMLVENIEDVIHKMTELKSHGLRFSLDDFGTGYSSLAYLKRLPLDQLKIDRSFIRDIMIDKSSAAIAQTIISLSRAMGLPVIAEGVETEEQREFLTRLGCHAFQGYLFSRPLPLDEFEKQWLPAGRDAVSAARR